MGVRITILFLIASIQVACCSQASTYPVIADVSRIEVTNGGNIPVVEIKVDSQISGIVRFIDERHGRWCSKPFGSSPQAPAMLGFYLENKLKGVIGFGGDFFAAKLSGGEYSMDISDEEKQEFLRLLGAKEEDVFGKRLAYLDGAHRQSVIADRQIACFSNNFFP